VEVGFEAASHFGVYCRYLQNLTFKVKNQSSDFDFCVKI